MNKLSKNIWALGVVSLLTDLSSEMLTPVLPLFLANVLKVDKSIIGLIEGIAESTASLLKVYSGWLSDRINARKILIFAGYGLSALAKPILLLATGWPTVLGYRFVDRIGKGIRSSPRDAIIADSIAETDRGMAFGFHKMMDTTGAVLGPLVAYLILAKYPFAFSKVFWAAIIPAVLGVACILFFVRDKKIIRAAAKPLPSFNIRVMGPSFGKFLIVILLFSLATFSEAFLALRAQDMNIKLAAVPLLFLFFNLIAALLAYPTGVISDRIGRKGTLLFGYSLFCLVNLGFAFGAKPIHAWLLFALFGLYSGATAGVQKAMVVDLVAPELRGTALGTYNSAVGIAAFPASLLAGILWQNFGAPAPFIFAAVISLIASILFYFLIPGKTDRILQDFS
ncbi:MAG: MFS transporter [Carboxydocellales bacterium]